MKNIFRLCLITALSLPCALFARRDEGLLIYMDFDDATEPMKNISGTDRVPGTLGTRPTAKIDDGKFVYSALFTNSNKDRSVDNYVINLGELDGYFQDSFSVAFWFMTNKKGSTNAVVTGNKNWSKPNQPGWAVTQVSGKSLSLSVGGANVEIDFPRLTDGNWHHVALVVDRRAGTVSFYGDGKRLGAPRKIPAGTIGNGGETLVGGSGEGYYSAPGSKNHKALIDDYAIWRRPLTEKEITAMWKEGQGARVPEPAALPLIFGAAAGIAALALVRRRRKGVR